MMAGSRRREYLSALEIRFVKTCCKSVGSASHTGSSDTAIFTRRLACSPEVFQYVADHRPR